MDTSLGKFIASRSRVIHVSAPRRGLWRGGVAVAAVAMGTLLAFVRLPGMAQKTIWAEDGGIFLRDAMAAGWLGVFEPYEGYLHVVPRLAANIVVAIFPVDHYALAMNVLSCSAVAAVALLVFHLSGPFSGSTIVRLCWAAVTIMVAPGPLETLGNFANIHWYLLWLTPWLLLRPARNLFEGVGLLSLAVIVATTEIISVLFIPLFLYKLLDKGYWPARIGLTLGLSCQILTTLLFPRSPSSGYPINLISIFEGWFLNSSSALIYGDSVSIIRNIQNFGAVPIVLAAVPFLLAFAFTIQRGALEHRLLAVVMLTASFASWAAAQIANPQPFFDYASFANAEWETFFLSRYSTAPSMFLLALVPLAAGVAITRWQSLASALLGAFVIMQVVFFFPSVVARMDGPSWSEGVSAARQSCGADRGLGSVGIPIAPKGWFADTVLVQCERLRN